jgi:Xaa-Pro aminopeptidase
MQLLDGWTDRLREPFTPERVALELTPEHIIAFRKTQDLAYACAVAVEKQLAEGITEQGVARLMYGWLADHGVREFFHVPFVWFGERTTLRTTHEGETLGPSERRLKEGDPIIMDVAPVVDGHAADIGYACALGENPVHARMLEDLVPYRGLILRSAKAKKTQSEIYRELNVLIEGQGYENRHQAYPDRVLGHRVGWTPEHERSPSLVGGFGLRTFRVAMAAKMLARSDANFVSPLWNDQATSDRPASPGLWAIEPHVGLGGIGAKWEEILVVTEDDAYWLSDSVPHVTRFAS